MAVEEIQGITYDFAGERLNSWQAAQRLYKAGFVDAKILATGYAVMMAESGCYLRAWHHNVVRNEDGTITRDVDGNMTIKSSDLGFIQRNVLHSTPKVIPANAVDASGLAAVLFDQNPDLANGSISAEIAWDLFQTRGWQPWYAHTNGSYKKSLPTATVAVGRFLAMALCGNPDIVHQNVDEKPSWEQ